MANERLGDALVVWEANVTLVARPAVDVAGIAGGAACRTILSVVVDQFLISLSPSVSSPIVFSL